MRQSVLSYVVVLLADVLAFILVVGADDVVAARVALHASHRRGEGFLPLRKEKWTIYL